MVLRNQQTDAPNFVKLFYEKSPLLRGKSSYKRGLHPIISPENRKRGVQITSNASQTALTSMLETVKIGVWKTPERLDAMRFSRAAAQKGDICENQQDRWRGGSTNDSQRPISRDHRSRCSAMSTSGVRAVPTHATASSAGIGTGLACGRIWRK